ncbi:restriction endonuclease subunit S [soil metagenome]
MSPDTLSQHFDAIADAPNGVQKLRDLILQLAVRGKLVPQDPSDEPALSILKKGAEQSERSDWTNEREFPLPESWSWVRLDELVDLEIGKTPSTKEPGFWADQDAGMPWVSIGDMPAVGIVSKTGRRISMRAAEGVFKRGPAPAGTLLMSFKLSIGKVALLNEPAYFNEAVVAIRPEHPEVRDYLMHCLRGIELHADTNAAIKGSTLNSSSLQRLPIPLPPLPEQRRIVEKVNQLMALCDELEERQQRRAEARTRMNRASLHHLTAATNDTQLAEHWRRIRDNFHRLYDAPETVTELRQAILQLAVRGKLVPQDPSDEPASMLLDRIQAERERLHKAGEIRKPKPLLQVGPDEVAFEVPEGWAWVRLGVVVDQRLGKMLDKSKNKGDLHPYLRNTNVQWLRFDLADIKEMRFQPAELEEYGLEKGDLLVCEGGEPGRCAIWPGGEGRVMFQKALHRVRPFTGVDPWFVLYNLRADALSGLIAKYFTGATIKHMTGQALTRYVLPLPPTAEQRRIVRKVDQLMALCDELEAKLTRSRTTAESLASAVVHHLTAA